MNDDLIEKIARAICVQNLISTRQPTDAATIDAYWQSFKAEARAALSAIEKSGTHVVVPVKATDAMVDAAYELGAQRFGGAWPTSPINAYSAMLSARPPLPETEGKG